MDTHFCGTIHIVPLRARKLKSVQKIGKQDPYIRWTLLPFDESVHSKTLKGTNPVWEEDPRDAWGSRHERFIHYPGKPADNVAPQLLVEVMDHESMRSDRLIGTYTMDLATYLRPYQPQVVELELKDKKDEPAGYLEFTFNFIAIGTLKLSLIGAKNLTNLKPTAHDTFVRATLLPSEETRKGSHAKGEEPDWTEKRRNVLAFEIDGSCPPNEIEMDIEVVETHVIGSDRVIGYKVISVGQYITMYGEEVTSQLLVKLTDDDEHDAGDLRCAISFENDAYDPKQNVVPPKASSLLSGGTKVFDAVSKRAISLSKNVVGAMPMNKEDVGQSMLDTYALSVAELKQISLFQKLEKATGVSAGLFANVVAVALVVSLLSAWITHGTKLVSLIVGVLFPCWKSFKALESPQKDDDTRWLTYWMTFGCLKLAEESLFAIFVEFNPSLYYFLKMILVVWLVHPFTKGSLVVYRFIVAPFLREFQDEIEDTIHRAKRWRFSTRSSRTSSDYSSNNRRHSGYGFEHRRSSPKHHS